MILKMKRKNKIHIMLVCAGVFCGSRAKRVAAPAARGPARRPPGTLPPGRPQLGPARSSSLTSAGRGRPVARGAGAAAPSSDDMI